MNHPIQYPLPTMLAPQPRPRLKTYWALLILSIAYCASRVASTSTSTSTTNVAYSEETIKISEDERSDDPPETDPLRLFQKYKIDYKRKVSQNECEHGTTNLIYSPSFFSDAPRHVLYLNSTRPVLKKR